MAKINEKILLADPPIAPNPSIHLDSLTPSFVVKWSPPFLWQGQHINHFQVGVHNLTDGGIVVDRVNTTFKDVLVTYVQHLTQHQLQMCTELLFSITAIDHSNGILKTINITGKSTSS